MLKVPHFSSVLQGEEEHAQEDDCAHILPLSPELKFSKSGRLLASPRGLGRGATGVLRVDG